jgi:hypothetical protein
VFLWTTRGYIRPEIPRIKKRLKLLLPITLPNEASLRPFTAEIELTTNSGADVPNATTVKPMAIFEILNFLAMDDEPFTRKSAPFISTTKPTRSNTISKNIDTG